MRGIGERVVMGMWGMLSTRSLHAFSFSSSSSWRLRCVLPDRGIRYMDKRLEYGVSSGLSFSSLMRNDE